MIGRTIGIRRAALSETCVDHCADRTCKGNHKQSLFEKFGEVIFLRFRGKFRKNSKKSLVAEKANSDLWRIKFMRSRSEGSQSGGSQSEGSQSDRRALT